MTGTDTQSGAGMTVGPRTSPSSITVVIVAVNGTRSIARTVRNLSDQTIRRSIEVVVVAATRDAIDSVALGADAFAAFRVVAVGPITKRGAAAAAGVMAATSAVVALIEDHSFPEPGWAAALVAAHDGPWSGVGPVVENANVLSTMSWVNFILSYGVFSGEQEPGEREILPWHNSAYKRRALDPFADRLGDLLEWEGQLQDALRASGSALYLEPRARTRHMNVSRFDSTLGLNLQRGRLLGAQRAEREGWPSWRRLAQAAAFPIFPFLQLRHAASRIREMPIPRELAAKVHAGLFATLCVMAAAEAWGLVLGAGDAVARMEDYELHRDRHLTGADLAEAALVERARQAPDAASPMHP
ncbi:MAG: glycosyltransferase [Gemmatimonadaceae bacterium]